MANTFEEVIRLRLETLGVENAVDLAQAFGRLEEEAKSGEGAAKGLVEQLGKLAETTQAAADFAQLSAETDKLREAFDAANERAYSLKSAMQGVEEPTRAMQQEFAKANREVQQLGAKLSAQESALEETGAALRAAGVDTGRLVQEQARLDDELRAGADAAKQQSQALEVNRAAAERNAEALKRMAASFQSAREGANQLVGRLAAAGAAAATAAAAFAAYKTGQFFSGAIEQAAEFQAQISEIGAVSGASDAELQKLEATAVEAGLNTGDAFKEVNKTLGELARAVGDASVAAQALGPTLDLATAGGLEAAKAAEILTTTLTQFGLEASNATRVADLLANGANATTASVEQLGNSLSYAAPLARQLGMSVDETVAAIGALADEGFRGERAGTALRNVLSALSDPASKFSVALDAMGIGTRNFNEVVVQLAAKGEAGKQALLKLDSEARPAILALVNSGATNIARLTASFDAMAVTAASAAAKMRDNLAGAASQASVAFDHLRNELVEPLLEPLTAELQALAVELKSFAASPEFGQIREALKDMFVDGTEAGKEFLSQVDFKQLADDISNFARESGDKLREFGENAQEYFGYLKDALNGLSVVFNAVQAGIFGLAAAFTKALEVTTRLQAEILALGEKLNALTPMGEALNAVWEKLGLTAENLREVGGGLGAVYDEFADRTIANLEETGAAMDRLADTTRETGTATDQAATVSENSWERVQQKLREFEAQQKRTTEAVEQSGDAAEATAEKRVAAEVSATEEIAALQQRRLDLQRQIDAAIASGASAETLRPLVNAYTATNDEIGKISALLDAGTQSTQALTESAQQLKQSFSSAADAAGDVGAGITDAGDQARASTDLVEGIIGDFLRLQAAYRKEFQDTSDAAVAMFDQLNGLNEQLVSVNWERAFSELTGAAEQTRSFIRNSKQEMDGLSASYLAFAETGVAAHAQIALAAAQGEDAMREMADAVREGRGGFDLLNQADLDTLADSIGRAADKVRDLKALAQEAKEELADIAGSMQDELDRREGNEEALLRRQFEAQLARIRELSEAGGVEASEQARRAEELAKRNFDAELARIQAEKNARIEADREVRRERDAAVERETGDARSEARIERDVRVEVVFDVTQRTLDVDFSKLSNASIREIARRVFEEVQRMMPK